MYSGFMWASTSGEGAEAGDAETAAALVPGHSITAEWLYLGSESLSNSCTAMVGLKGRKVYPLQPHANLI